MTSFVQGFVQSFVQGFVQGSPLTLNLLFSLHLP